MNTTEEISAISKALNNYFAEAFLREYDLLTAPACDQCCEMFKEEVPRKDVSVEDCWPIISSTAKFDLILKKMHDTYESKNADYGDSFHKTVEKYGLIAALTRMSDKFRRCETLVLNGRKNKVSDESLYDTLIDLASYAIMTAMELEKK